MAKPLPLLLLFLLFLTITTTTSSSSSSSSSSDKLKRMKKKKLTHFTVYWHDIVSGPNPSGAMVAQAPTTNTSTTSFGLVRIIDNPLTKGPTMSSDLLSHAQGFYAFTSLESVGLFIAMNFVFTSGKYNGSTVTILGRDEVFTDVREMPVIGGSGFFRWAQGYAQARTSTVNMTTHDAVVKYNVHVMHY